MKKTKLLTIAFVLLGFTFMTVVSCNKIETAPILNGINDIKKQNDSLLQLVIKLQTTIDSVQSQVNQNTGLLNSINTKVTSLQVSVGVLITNITLLNSKMDSANANIGLIQQQVTNLSKQYQSLSTQISTIFGAISNKIDSLSLQTNINTALLNNLQKEYLMTQIKVDSILLQIQINNLLLTSSNNNIALIQQQLITLTNQYNNILILLNQLIALLNNQSVASGLTNGLVAWYPFTGNANDSSGNGNNGTVFGATLTTDRFGNSNKAYYVNGINGYIKTNSVLQNIANTFSISIWVYPTMPDNIITQGITGKEGYGSQSVIHPSHGINWGDQLLNAGVGIYVGTNQIEVIEHTYLYEAAPIVYSANLGGWHHIVLVYNKHVPSLFVDGYLVKTGLVSNIQNVRPSNGFDSYYPSSGFGRSFSPTGSPNAQYTGSFDDISIYNRVLTQAEINYLAAH